MTPQKSNNSNNKIQTTLRLPNTLHSLLKNEAKKKGLSVTSIILNILWNNLKNESEQL